MTMSPGEKRRDFFVSFNSADHDYAEWIAAELEKAGKTVFFQHWDFRPGNNFVLEMNRAEILADRTIAVLSESYLEAFFTQPEWAKHFADDPTGAARRLIPVRVQECKVDGLLKAIVHIDLVGCEEGEARKRLLEGVREGRAKPELVAFPGRDAGRGAPTREEELRYLARLIWEEEARAERYSALRGIEEKRRDGASHRRRRGVEDADIALLRLRSPRGEIPERVAVRDYEDILTAFADVRRAALLGAPGSGKSTTLRKLAVELARASEADPEEPLPLLAYLGNWKEDEPLAQFIRAQAPEIGWAMEELNRAGRLLLLLDGLNETPTQKRGTKAAEVVQVFEKLERDTKVIVSCRLKDYTGELDLGCDTLTLEPLSPQRVRAALRHWLAGDENGEAAADRLFWQLAGDERLAAVQEAWLAAGAGEESFWQDPKDAHHDLELQFKVGWQGYRLWHKHLSDPRSLLKLAANPFMLNMLFRVWESEGKLPKNRGDLFARFIDRLLYREGLVVKENTGEWRRTAEGERLLAGLAALAWRMQRVRIEAGQGEGGDFGVLTVSARDAALESLGNEALLKKALDGTLLEGDEEIRFRHQLLQEYFTAQALRGRMGQMTAAELWPADRWWERSGWEETAVLLAGFYSDDCSPVIRWVGRAQPEVAAQCIVESGAEVANKEALLGELETAWRPLLTDVKKEARPEARAAVGRALGRLYLDKRKGVGVKNGVPAIDWVEIPGGQFLYQKNKRRKVETFYMARYPVTNAQYEAFLNAEDGYGDDRWWEGLTDPDRSRRQQSWSEFNHPRETVSWHEAMAFCAWLSHKAGFEVRLPTEWEWERAARGTNGRIYPWGDKYVAGYANINETYEEAGPHDLGRTSAVGIYPDGASAEGLLDLSGNVWEWCLNEYGKPDRIQPGGKESRVLRGGSWLNYPGFARAGSRNDRVPGGRGLSVGFRLVCSSPIR